MTAKRKRPKVRTATIHWDPSKVEAGVENRDGARAIKRHRPKVAKSKMGDAFKATNTRYATAIAIVYDTICCPCCTCPEHRSGKIRSEIRFDSMPPTETFRGWAKHVTSFPLDRERGNGPMNAKAVRARAAVLAELIGVPLEDETR